jgi:hypothetical protein
MAAGSSFSKNLYQFASQLTVLFAVNGHFILAIV